MYIAIYVTESGHKIIRAIKEEQDSYDPQDNEIVISKEVFDFISNEDGLIKPYRITVDKDVLDDTEDVDEYLNFSSNKLFVAYYHLEDDKKWLNGIEEIDQQEMDYDLFVLLDNSVYYFLNSSELDLGLNIYYVDHGVTRVTLPDLKKATTAYAAEMSATDALGLLAKSFQNEAKRLLDSRINQEAICVMAKFTLLNNILGSKGFIITDANRQEQYNKIVESGDKDLLAVFSEYLDLYHKVIVNTVYYDAYTKFVTDSNNAKFKSDLQALWYEYLQKNFQ